MVQSFRQNAVLPDLPFVNREDHLEKIVGLFEDQSEASINIAVMDGEGGLGKTEVLKRAASKISNSSIVIWLPVSSFEGNHKSIIENAFAATLNTLGKDTKLGRSAHKKQATIDIVRSLLPKISSDVEEVLDVGSDTMFGAGQSLVVNVAKYYDLKGFTMRARFNHLLNQIWRSGKKTVFIVDDLHELSALEGQQLINFMNALDGANETSSKWTVLMTTHPIGEHLSKSNALSVLWSLRNRWSFTYWTMGGLEEFHMNDLAERYILNSEHSSILVDVSAGNPRKFFEIVQKLALQDRCDVQNDQVTLLGDINDVVVLDQTFERTLKNDRILRQVCGTLILGADKVPITTIHYVCEQFDPSRSEYRKKIKLLLDLSYVVMCENDIGDLCYKMADDDKIAMVKAALEADSMSVFELHRALVEGYLSCFSKDVLFELRRMGSPAESVAAEEISAPNVGYFIQASVHAAASNYADSQVFAVSSLRILDHFSRYAEVVQHGQVVAVSVEKVLPSLGEVIICINSLISKAYYHLGDYVNCADSLSWDQLEAITNSEILYYYAKSTVIAKIDPEPIKKTKIIASRVRSNGFVDKSWEPQIVTAHAFSYQEYGKYIKSVSVYSAYFLRSFLRRNDFSWHTFAMMSPLFLPVAIAKMACQSAYNFFQESGDMRLAGMSLHNLGYCHLRILDLKKAYKLFQESDKILSESAAEEAGFAKINMAFIHLLRGEPEKAKLHSSDALKHFSSPFYISASRVNLALADWQLGMQKAVEHLDQIPQTRGLLNDPRQVWRIAFNRAFIILNSSHIVPDQALVDELFDRISSSGSLSAAAEFWNKMALEKLIEYPHIVWPMLPEKKGLEKIFINTKLAPFRASTLCFGHA